MVFVHWEVSVTVHSAVVSEVVISDVDLALVIVVDSSLGTGPVVVTVDLASFADASSSLKSSSPGSGTGLGFDLGGLGRVAGILSPIGFHFQPPGSTPRRHNVPPYIQ